MEVQTHKNDWRAILVLVFSLGSIALLFITALFLAGITLFNEYAPAEFAPSGKESPLPMAIIINSLVAIGLLQAVLAWISFQRLRGQEAEPFHLPSLRVWGWILISGIWVAALILASLFFDAKGAVWYAPFLHLLSIALPIYLITRIGINKIGLGSKLRAWGVFNSGMVLSTALAFIAESILIGTVAVMVMIYLSTFPDKLYETQRILENLGNTLDTESMLYLLEPFLMSPLAPLGAIAFLSVLVPFVEEIAKSLGIWFISGRLTSPAQGFALGFLSGAGFALAESLFATAAADEGWGMTLSIRAFSGMMHMLASGLVGWGIAYARLEKRWLRMLGATLFAMILHGIWNAGAILTAIGGVRTMLVMPDVDFPGVLMGLFGMSIIGVLILAMLVALFLVNYKLRNVNPVQAEIEPASPVG